MYGIPNAEESYSQYRDKDDDDIQRVHAHWIGIDDECALTAAQ